MDDLDHSIHIAEYDWSSFYDESEECHLLQPSLAYSDDSGLSDSEDLGNSSLVQRYGQKESQRNHDAESNAAEENFTGSAKLPEQLNQRDNRGPVDEDAAQVGMSVSGSTKVKEAVHKEIVQEITEVSDSSSKTLQSNPLNVQCSGETKEQTQDCFLQRESDLKSTKEPDPLFSNQMGLSVSELDTAERAVRVIKAEKERWFVTVNYIPTQQRRRSATFKKKRKIKKHCEGGLTWSLRQENSAGSGVEMNKDKHKSAGRKNSQSNRSKKPGRQNAVQVISESPEKGLDPQSFTKSITQEVIRSKHDSDSSALASPEVPSQVEHMQSDKPEFISVDSYDSETYLSADGSPQCHLIAYTQHSVSPACDSLTDDSDTDQAKSRQMCSLECAFSSHTAATHCKDYESTCGEPSITFPSADRGAIKTPDDDSTCKKDTPADASGPQTLSANLSASACSQGDQLDPLCVPNLPVSPCSVADNPETFAKATGHSQPVYAISAFWDEMEKLTINDILQLRMSKISPPMTHNADDFSLHRSSDVDDVEHDLADCSLMDTSDTADSDYFTQTDESKPEHSSCEFFTSDFEEEYWQFIRSSRTPNPDHNSNTKQRNSPFLSHEDNSSNSEGRETPVPLEDVAGQFLASGPRMLTKSNSMYNVQALNTEHLSLLPLLHHDCSLSTSRPLPLEEDVDLKASSGPGTLIASSFSSNTDLLNAHYQISFPEMFEYFFTEDNATTETHRVAMYDPKDISVASVVCAYEENTSHSFPLQCSMDTSIPIFSCSHPTVRELTFPKQHFVLSANSKKVGEMSPIRVVSNSFIQADLRGCSAVAVGAPRGSLLSLRKISFHDKGSIWCRGSGVWMFPFKNEEIPVRRENQTAVVLKEGRICPASSQVYGELKEQRIYMKREGILPSVNQSDMCLVCIAFASWVLRSSDPEGADAWKAALLANVSALSAIQYLRQYVKKRDLPDDL